MTFDKFTIKAQEVVQEALNTAQRSGQQSIEPMHLLKALLVKAKDVTTFIFQKLGVNAMQVESVTDAELQRLPRVQGGQPYLSNDTNAVLQHAQDFATKNGDEFTSVEPILLALLQVNSTASRILKDAGMTEADTVKAIQELRQGEKIQSQSADENFQSLSKYAKNLVEEARQGKLDPVIGRDDEIRRVLQILSRRTKNNPILIGVLPIFHVLFLLGDASLQLPDDNPHDCRRNAHRGDKGQNKLADIKRDASHRAFLLFRVPPPLLRRSGRPAVPPAREHRSIHSNLP